MLYSLSDKRACMGFKCSGLYSNLLQLLKPKWIHELSWLPHEQQCQCYLAMTAKIMLLLTYSQIFVNIVELLHTVLEAVLQTNCICLKNINLLLGRLRGAKKHLEMDENLC